jgi:hypothetical protein
MKSEADYLAEQMAQARLALSRTLHEMAESLKDAADPRGWTANYPWASLSTAAVVGFLIASAVIPSRDEKLRECLKNRMPEAAAEPGAAPATAGAVSPPKASKTSMILGPLMDAARTVLVSVIASAVSGKAYPGGNEPPQQPSPAFSTFSEPSQDPTEPL